MAPDAVAHEWDLDGDGTYERSTGDVPQVDTSFTRGGRVVVGLRATLGDGSVLTATRPVTVQRPPVMQLTASPSVPKPGQQATLRLATRSDGMKFRYFTWKIDGVKPARTTISLGGQDLTVKGAEPTTVPQLKVRFPRTSNFRVEVIGVGSDGSRTALHASVPVGKSPAPTKISTERVCDGTEPSNVPCPSLVVLGTPATGVRALFLDATPSKKICVPRPGSNVPAAISDVQNLPYPDPTAFGAPGDVVSDAGPVGAVGGPQAQARTRRAPGRARASQSQDCNVTEAETISWDFGDGTKIIGALAGNADPEFVGHRYAKAGDYTVTLTTRIPTVPLPGGGTAKGGLSVVATTKVKITVVDAFCGSLSLRGVVVRSAYFQQAPGDADKPLAGQTFDQDAAGCWIREKLGTSQVYRPFPGYGIDVGPGVVLRNPEAFVNPADGAIQTPAGTLEATLRLPETAGLRLGAVPSLVMPDTKSAVITTKPDGSPDRTEKVASLPGFVQPGAKFTNLPVQGGDVHFFKGGRRALVRLDLIAPKPIAGGAAPTVLGGQSAAQAASTAEDDKNTDFVLDLSGKDLGFLKVNALVIKHRVKGGWLGGADLTIPAFKVNVKAPYKRRPTGATQVACYKKPTAAEAAAVSDPNDKAALGIDGPSGISLNDNGSFEFGGLAVIGEPIFALGPVALTCVSIAGKSDPFVITGKIDAEIADAFDLNVCVIFAKLKKKGDHAEGCEIRAEAPSSLTWLHAIGRISVKKEFELGAAYFDMQKDYDEATGELKNSVIRAGGAMDHTIAGFDLDFGLKGTIWEQPGKKTLFDVYGFGTACTPDLVVIPTGCYGAQGVVSSYGIGACYAIGGLKYRWRDDLPSVFAGCDMSDSDLRIDAPNATIEDRFLGRARAAQLPATSRATKVVPKDSREVSFELQTAKGTIPRATLTAPGGRKIVVDETQQDREGKRTGIMLLDGRAFVRVKRPAAGTWSIEVPSGGPALTGVGLARQLAEPRVNAVVRGTGRSRRLSYRAVMPKGDVLRFEEHHGEMSRQLTAGRNGARVVPFTTGTAAPGRRRIVAVVERRGLPYKRYTVASYTAPPRPVAGTPRRLKVLRRGDTVTASWAPAANAASYEVTARVGARVWTLDVRKPSVRLRGVSRRSAVRISVVAVTRGDRKGRPALRSLSAIKAPKRRIAL